MPHGYIVNKSTRIRNIVGTRCQFSMFSYDDGHSCSGGALTYGSDGDVRTRPQK